MAVYIGIDPGASGGIGVIIETAYNGTDVSVTSFALPYSDEIMVDTFTSYPDAKVMVEQVHAMPGNGSTSMFNFGKAFGFILGVLAAYKVPYQMVPPTKWKREFSVTADKKTSIACCKRLFPTVELRRNAHCRTDHDGMAEALLIAEYARRKMK